MPRKYLMNWDGTPNYRWRKMHKGAVYVVTCEQLRSPLYTQEGSGKLADEWWKKKLAEIEPADPAQEILKRVGVRMGDLTKVIEAGIAARALVMNLPMSGEDTREAVEKIIGIGPIEDANRRVELLGRVVDKVLPTPQGETVGVVIDEFLRILRTRNQKAKTYQEVADVLDVVRSWWASLGCKEIDEAKIAAAWTSIAEMQVGANSKKKRWNIVRRFVEYMVETHRMEAPSQPAFPPAELPSANESDQDLGHRLRAGTGLGVAGEVSPLGLSRPQLRDDEQRYCRASERHGGGRHPDPAAGKDGRRGDSADGVVSPLAGDALLAGEVQKRASRAILDGSWAFGSAIRQAGITVS